MYIEVKASEVLKFFKEVIENIFAITISHN